MDENKMDKKSIITIIEESVISLKKEELTDSKVPVETYEAESLLNGQADIKEERNVIQNMKKESFSPNLEDKSFSTEDFEEETVTVQKLKEETVTTGNCNSDGSRVGPFCFVSCGAESDNNLGNNSNSTENSAKCKTELYGTTEDRSPSSGVTFHYILYDNAKIVNGFGKNNVTLTSSGSKVNEKIQCARCGKMSGCTCYMHIERTNENQCEESDKHFPHQSMLLRYKQIQNIFYCNICNKKFYWLRALSQHKRIHGYVKTYSCDMCNKIFTMPSHLSRHRETHFTAKKYYCSKCKEPFCSVKELSKHIAQHPKYKCDICSEMFTQKYYLLLHALGHKNIKTHENMKQFYLNVLAMTGKK